MKVHCTSSLQTQQSELLFFSIDSEVVVNVFYVQISDSHSYSCLCISSSRYIELFRSTKSEIKPIKSHRPTPYDRPHGGRGGGYGGYGGYGGGDRHRSGYERSYRGRRGGRGGYYQPYDEYDSYSGGTYENYTVLDFNFCTESINLLF